MFKLKFVGENTGLFDIIYVSEIIEISSYKFRIKTRDLNSTKKLLNWYGDVFRWSEDSQIENCSKFYDYKRNVVIGCDEYFGCFPETLYNTNLQYKDPLISGDNISCYFELSFDYKRDPYEN